MILAGAGPLSAAVLAFAATTACISATVVVSVRRSLLWLVLIQAALAVVILASIRSRGGMATVRDDTVWVGLLCSVGLVVGAAPAVYVRWLCRVFRDAERRLSKPG